MRDLNQDAGAVASFRIASACATVRQVYEDLNSLLDDLVAFFSTNARDKADSAGIVLVRRIIETLSGR